MSVGVRTPRFRLVEQLRAAAATASEDERLELYIEWTEDDGRPRVVRLRANGSNIRRLADELERRWTS